MAQRAQPPQDGGDEAAHQRPIAIGKTFQSGMGGRAIELFVEGAMLVQHAVENVSCDPPRREAGRFRWQSESLRGHGAGTSCILTQQFAFQLTPPAGIALASEYAKCKNLACDFYAR